MHHGFCYGCCNASLVMFASPVRAFGTHLVQEEKRDAVAGFKLANFGSPVWHGITFMCDSVVCMCVCMHLHVWSWSDGRRA